MIPCSAGQCPVSVPTIVSSSSSDDICRVVSQETLTYTCNNDDNDLTWRSSVFDSDFNVIAGSMGSLPSSTVSGVTIAENNNGDGSCLNSTLTFSGNLTSLIALNGVPLRCTATGQTSSSVTIMIPSKCLGSTVQYVNMTSTCRLCTHAHAVCTIMYLSVCLSVSLISLWLYYKTKRIGAMQQYII